MFSLLIVDDHKHLVESMLTTIAWQQYGVAHVYGAHSGYEALELMLSRDIDVLVTDIRMPGMSGLELIERVRAGWPGVDCILLTGFADFQYAQKAIELQAAHYLLKPVRDEELLPLIARLLGRRRSEQEERARVERLALGSEITALEERRRIAHELHDLLGHTLTGTIVQLEAAKTLLEAGKAGGLERVKLTQELVRRGLADVRQAVGAIRDGGEALDLEAALRRELETLTTEARLAIEPRLSLPEPVADPIRVKLVLLALKEGVTNGLRHGGAQRFTLELRGEPGLLSFELWNDGKPYDGGGAPGLGLSGMRERLRPLGGAVSLTAGPDGAGALLRLLIPLQEG
ncbi:response regulator [Paenibacillus athensensis]|uniref:histidine kinase n=1 Tax=Paenibacillus athensensis TaxID=1967502 RepID=A0A4Y8PQX9_9BACL|nr:response regulator [Paenibacillus athensensis]MCD1257264.1 response regulator [Paenibacillus athensensis]